MHIATGTGLFLLFAIFVIFPLADRFCASASCWLMVFVGSLTIFLFIYAYLYAIPA
jgi:hypothetical protein